jgi:hypothetical protein
MNLIDARFAAQPHACYGTWNYNGLNSGGHEIYTCDRVTDEHVIIWAHVAADHKCSDVCAIPFPVPGRCPRCNGLTGTECLGGIDCDINIDLARDGVDPSAYRNTDL